MSDLHNVASFGQHVKRSQSVGTCNILAQQFLRYRMQHIHGCSFNVWSLGRIQREFVLHVYDKCTGAFGNHFKEVAYIYAATVLARNHEVSFVNRVQFGLCHWSHLQHNHRTVTLCH